MQSDIIYIPKRILPELFPVLEHIIVHQPKLFCEVATALAVNIASAGFVQSRAAAAYLAIYLD